MERQLFFARLLFNNCQSYVDVTRTNSALPRTDCPDRRAFRSIESFRRGRSDERGIRGRRT
jgi:hypothetical protein